MKMCETKFAFAAATGVVIFKMLKMFFMRMFFMRFWMKHPMVAAKKAMMMKYGYCGFLIKFIIIFVAAFVAAWIAAALYKKLAGKK
jgi:hypothetical protein